MKSPWSFHAPAPPDTEAAGAAAVLPGVRGRRPPAAMEAELRTQLRMGKTGIHGDPQKMVGEKMETPSYFSEKMETPSYFSEKMETPSHFSG